MNELLKAIAEGASGVSVTISAADLREVIAEMARMERESAAEKEKGNQGMLTRKEAMGRLRVSMSTMIRWMNEGVLVPVRIGGKLLYRSEDVESITERRAS